MGEAEKRVRTILLVLPGSTADGAVDYYQVLQEETAIAEAAALGLALEVVHAPGFDHLRVIRKRLSDTGACVVDAVVVEPGSLSSTDLLVKELKGRAGRILLNAWSPAVEEHAASWGAGLPVGTVSTDHAEIGRIQALQVNTLAPDGGSVLCVTGSLRSSAAQQRLAGLKSALKAGLTLRDTEAGEWTEAGGARAFESWYGLFRSRRFELHAIAAQSDELAVGARRAALETAIPAHRDMLAGAKLLGVDACPDYGRRLVDEGKLTASVVAPAHRRRAPPAAPILGGRPACSPPQLHPRPALPSLERGLLTAYGAGAATRSGHWRASWPKSARVFSGSRKLTTTNPWRNRATTYGAIPCST
jgi:ABC-type sugar transport system substrate-binding protein